MPALDHRLANSPCFRTDASGAIPLRPDWPTLLPALREWGEWYIQTRHAFARLVARTRLPEWRPDPYDATARRDPGAQLHLRLAPGCDAVARLTTCPCCSSPGTIELRTKRGHTVFELRAPAGRTPIDLSTIPTRFASTELPRERPTATTGTFPLLERCDLPRVPVAHLPALLRHCGESGILLLWRLLTPESDHRRVFSPGQVSVSDGILTAADALEHSCQLALPSARSLVCERTAGTALLHVVAEDDTILLTLADAGSPDVSPGWEIALASLSSQFRQP